MTSAIAPSRARTHAIFWVVTAMYLICGTLLGMHYGYLQGDALSRVAAARSVFFSRDPHLAAIGFIFTPLTTLAQLPLTLLSPWASALTRWGLTGLVSAPFMAGAVVQIYKIAFDRGCAVGTTIVVTALFALNPMIVFYGANGMSEALFLLCLCWAVRRLIRWTSTDDVHDLVATGIGLGLAYLTRYDALAAAAAIAPTVFVITALRHGYGQWRSRVRAALLDAVLITAPVLLAFGVWAATSWLITGEAFQQFSSAYGNTAILAQSGGGSTGGRAALTLTIGDVLALGPALLILVPIGVLLAWRRRDLDTLAALVGFGSVLAFAGYGYLQGLTFAFLRFYICAIPLLAVVTLHLSAPRGIRGIRRPGRDAVVRQQKPASRSATPLATVGAMLMAISLGITGIAMLNPTVSPQEFALRSIIAPDAMDTSPQRAGELRNIATFSTERRLAEYLDALALPRGSVLMDTVYGFAIFVATERPDTFVIPSDTDYTAILNQPAQHGIRYILSVPGKGRGESDAINRRYPTMYETGSSIATLELEIPSDGDGTPVWRLYRVLSTS